MDQIFSIAFLTSFLGAAVSSSAPLAYAALGEIYSEKAGILNIGLEAIMLAGAFSSFAAAYLFGNLWIGLLGGMLGGLLVCMLHAFLSVSLSQNQTIVGVALNMFMLGVTSYSINILVSSSTSAFPQVTTFPKLPIPVLSSIPILGSALFNQNILVYILYLLMIISHIFFKYTQWGNSLTAVGEHPRAADTAGIQVYKVQYISAAVNGIMGGIGGAYMVLAQLGVFTENLTAGRGFIALAIVIFGRREPIRVALAALLFGALEGMQFRMQAIGVNLPVQFMTMLPYLITMISLLGSIGKQRDPGNLGKPYIRSNK